MLNENSISLLKITDNVVNKLEKLNIYSLWDLIFHIPFKYEDETKITPIQNIQLGKQFIVEGTIIAQNFTYAGKKQLVLKISDGSKNSLNIRFIHFYPSQQQTYTIGKKIRAKGQVRQGFGAWEMVHPVIKSPDILLLTDRLTAIYPSVAGLTQENLSKTINNAFKYLSIEDYLPDKLIEQFNLIPFNQAIQFLHYPSLFSNQEEFKKRLDIAKNRLKFEELLAQQLSMKLARIKRKSLSAYPLISKKHKLKNKLLKSLNFELTNAQKKVLIEIENDLATEVPMNRLLQGDVGSGKTIIAALAALISTEANYQVAIIAPTEILAEQHYNKFSFWMDKIGITVGFLTGKQKLSEKKLIKEKLFNNEINILIGTHAVFQEDVSFYNLGLAIIDEQHRFGVQQRLALKNKGKNVHQLMMSATPIPRTLTMSYLADLDISIIDELPPGRMPIINKLINSNRIHEVERFAYNTYKNKQQIYWVCPLVEESEKLQLKTVTETKEKLKNIFPDLNIAVIHGRLKAQEKSTIMTDFKNKKIDILVATTVIEVGIDVPNATLMIIENAERIGLSQLHQLRGRIGRGKDKSICIFMFSEPLTNIAKKRLKVIFQNNDGFEISKQDLEIRGPGEVLGVKQSGAPIFKFADICHDEHILKEATYIVDQLLADYQNNQEIIKNILSRWPFNKINYLDA